MEWVAKCSGNPWCKCWWIKMPVVHHCCCISPWDSWYFDGWVIQNYWSVVYDDLYSISFSIIWIGNENKPRFKNPAGVQRAAAVLGISVDEITELVLSPPMVSQIVIRAPRRKNPSRLSSQSSETSSSSVQSMDNQRLRQCTAALEGLAMGLYQQAFGIMIYLINRLWMFLHIFLHCNIHWQGILNLMQVNPRRRSQTYSIDKHFRFGWIL